MPFRDGEEVIGCGFFDWGYDHEKPGMLIPFVCLFLAALKALTSMEEALSGMNTHAGRAEKVESLLKSRTVEPFCELKYHSSVLMLKENIIGAERKAECIAYIKQFILSCFPFDSSAPRLYSPTMVNERTVTPFFFNFSLWTLMEHNESKFVYDIIRKGWGYMLDTGATTCLEVFDTRWSHCHQFSSCPTWILSSYALGLHKRFERGVNHFLFRLAAGDISCASGLITLPDGGTVSVRWSMANKIFCIALSGPCDIFIHDREKCYRLSPGTTTEFILVQDGEDSNDYRIETELGDI